MEMVSQVCNEIPNIYQLFTLLKVVQQEAFLPDSAYISQTIPP